jgi:4-alpha-glucanotransferase
MKLNQDTDFSENQIVQYLIDFLLFRKDAPTLKNLLSDAFKSTSRSLLFSPKKTPVCKQALLEELQYKDELANSSKGSPLMIALKRLKLFLLLGMTVPGVPCIHCSEKEGFTSDNCIFNTTGEPVFRDKALSVTSLFKTLTALRSCYSVLRTGRWVPLIAENNVFGYLRVIKDNTDALGRPCLNNTAVVLVNRSRTESAVVLLDLGLWAEDQNKLVDVLDNYQEISLNNSQLTVELSPLEGKIYFTDRWAMEKPLKRRSGILLHPTSLPSNYGIGDLGIGAMEFVDFLEDGRQKLWQILPLNPPGYGNSPYQCLSAFAGNHQLIDIDQIVEQGLLRQSETIDLPSFPEDRVDFDQVSVYKTDLLRKAFRKFQQRPPSPAFKEFCTTQNYWLDNYCLFMALKKYHGGAPWNQWEEAAAFRCDYALTHYRGLLADEIEFHKFLQFEFFSQWSKLKHYANSKGIQIIGDLPIYVSHDSSDVWTHPELFHLDQGGNPTRLAGVPPDDFNETGQLWGNPIYRWKRMEETGYAWWKDRLRHLSTTVDLIRIDHFRGFEAYWEVPAGEATAVNGKWVKGPGSKFFEAVIEATGKGKIIAEDLGFITPGVKELKEKFGFPGMHILQFEMKDGRFNVPLYESNSVAYTGTHDNDTIWGWHLKNCADNTTPGQTAEEVCWHYIKMVMHTDAETAIIPLQDILCLGSRARMNTPGTATRNWEWRFSNEQLSTKIRERLRKVTKYYHR